VRAYSDGVCFITRHFGAHRERLHR
jgi:hypothetical protein